ncbi:MAG: hypothetical protein ACSHWQ_05510 [Spongiibacteraceae bacterium]
MLMDRGFIARLTLLLTASLLATVQALAGDWELAKESGDIRVYTRSIEGSDYREFKGELRLPKIGANQVLGLLDDTQACPQWMYNCLAPRLLVKPSQFERYTYMRNDLPWPYGDRELLVHSKIARDPQSGVISVSMDGVAEAQLPAAAQLNMPKAKKKYERPNSLSGVWQLTPESEALHVVYCLHIDLGGSPSASLANMQIADTPLHTLRKLQKLVVMDKYKDFNAF